MLLGFFFNIKKNFRTLIFFFNRILGERLLIYCNHLSLGFYYGLTSNLKVSNFKVFSFLNQGCELQLASMLINPLVDLLKASAWK